MTTLTTNYRFVLPDYNVPGWDIAMNNNIIQFDALIAQYNVGLNLQGIWTAGTFYPSGTSVIDGITGNIWANSLTHTSNVLPGTFATDRAAHPAYWTNITNPAVTAQQYAIAAAASAASAASARNRLINGALDIDQRQGSPYSSPAGTPTYSFDRWYSLPFGYTATITNTAGTTRGSSRYAAITGTIPIGGVFLFGQRIEATNTYDLVGQQITFSFYLDYTVSAGSLAFQAVIRHPTAPDNYAGTTGQQTVAIVPTAVPKLYTVTFGALSASAVNGVEVYINALQSGSIATFAINVGTLSMEVGSAANGFEHRSVAQELPLCKRYYEKSYAQTVKPGTAAQSAGSSQIIVPVAGLAGTSVHFGQTKRAIPTVTVYASDSGATGKASSTDAIDKNVTTRFIGDTGFSWSGVTVTSTDMYLQWTAEAEL